jgi:hypothetical protein
VPSVAAIRQERGPGWREEQMKKNIRSAASALFVPLAVAACVYTAAPGPDYVPEVAPPLPAVVELGDEPYYYHDGYHYYYHDNGWEYSRDRRGPWRELPKSHYPREMRYHGNREGGSPGGRGYEEHREERR